ncbi:MAG TPA: tetratricopeptide repeat protein, partial [Verrucomicrobiae bacterium]|nr:tetratricopeptide repeat protein [Verrucomicrobiae bacterium]
MRRFALAVAALAVALLATPALAAPSARNAFDAGIKAYRAGKYPQAVDHFLAARNRGMKDSNLDFNLGLAYYRANKPTQARELLSRVRADLRYTAVADYHLGLIAAQQGERELAYYYLESVQALAPTEDMRNLASIELRRLDDVPLEAGPTTPDVEFPGASYYARLAAGFDSNPELESGTQDVVTDESAGYADALANLAYPFLDTASGSTVFRADLHLRQHGDEAGYDQQSGEL